MSEFKCAQCDKWKPMVELGKPRIINGAPQNRCKSCGDNTQDADTETHFKVMIDEETTEVGVCVKCGIKEPLMSGRCFSCHDSLENMKNKARTQPPKEAKLAPPDLMKRYDTIKDVCEASEANRLLTIH